MLRTVGQLANAIAETAELRADFRLRGDAGVELCQLPGERIDSADALADVVQARCGLGVGAGGGAECEQRKRCRLSDLGCEVADQCLDFTEPRGIGGCINTRLEFH